MNINDLESINRDMVNILTSLKEMALNDTQKDVVYLVCLTKINNSLASIQNEIGHYLQDQDYKYTNMEDIYSWITVDEIAQIKKETHKIEFLQKLLEIINCLTKSQEPILIISSELALFVVEYTNHLRSIYQNI